MHPVIKKENILSAEAIAQQNLSRSLTENSSALACPHCSYENESGGTYCAECGALIQPRAICPTCNAVARPRADICEICGTWLLKGQCMFCYAYIAEDESYCGECGNPTAGITCQGCGKLSIFDFCKSCGIPLSIQAKELVQETAKDPSVNDMVSLFGQLTSFDDLASATANASANVVAETKPISLSRDDQVLRLKAYRDGAHKSVAHPQLKSTPKTLFSGEQKARISQLNEEILKSEEWKQREAEERKRYEEEQERKALEQLNEAMQQLNGKTFSSNQEARRFFMSIIAGFPEEVARKITDRGLSWRCNAYDCVHDSPGDCGDPSQGGVWLIR